MLDLIVFVIVAVGILSLAFLKKSIINRKITVGKIIGFVLLHIILPIFLLLVPSLLGATLWVGARFAPDLFAVLVFGSFALNLSGICKIVFCFRRLKKTN